MEKIEDTFKSGSESVTMDLRKIFSGSKNGDALASPELGALFDSIQNILESYTVDEIKRIAGVTGLMGYIAYCDMDISEDEMKGMAQTLEKYLHLPVSQAEAIARILSEHYDQVTAVEDHLYYNMINSISTREEKLDILRCLFIVAAADELISAEENSSIRLATSGLRLSHQDFVTVRMEYKKYREIYQNRGQ